MHDKARFFICKMVLLGIYNTDKAVRGWVRALILMMV